MSITINSVLTISPATLPNGDVGVPYAQTVSASGGVPPYTYSVSVGSLPPGLTLGALTGLISGTPTTPGVFPFTIHAVDLVLSTGDQAYD